eukprot:TRINITY_DN10165_c1_g1_i1.p1 TRINITY_DN10165_c1_g1~~TRINITY_DN10165_c1_g1_i1.p1  ORF type:complete len:1315 (-),score=424.41 TRINITY_DN10165_c1_g1_i1:43-3945(-)
MTKAMERSSSLGGLSRSGSCSSLSAVARSSAQAAYVPGQYANLARKGSLGSLASFTSSAKSDSTRASSTTEGSSSGGLAKSASNTMKAPKKVGSKGTLTKPLFDVNLGSSKADVLTLDDVAVGRRYEVKTPAVLRTGQGARSETKAFLKPGTTVEVLEQSDLERRRVKVDARADGGPPTRGWIDVVGEDGKLIISRSSEMSLSKPAMGSAAAPGRTLKSRGLIEAAMAGDVEAVKESVEGRSCSESHHLDLDSRDAEGRTALMHAAMCGSVAVVEYLLSRSGEVNVTLVDLTRRAALHHAARASRLAQVKQAESGSAAQIKLVMALLGAKANLEGRDQSGCTPLYLAAAGGHAEMAQSLVQAKADINAQDTEGRTVLDRAVGARLSELERQLRAAGAREGIRHEDLPSVSAAEAGAALGAARLVSASAVGSSTAARKDGAGSSDEEIEVFEPGSVEEGSPAKKDAHAKKDKDKEVVKAQAGSAAKAPVEEVELESTAASEAPEAPTETSTALGSDDEGADGKKGKKKDKKDKLDKKKDKKDKKAKEGAEGATEEPAAAGDDGANADAGAAAEAAAAAAKKAEKEAKAAAKAAAKEAADADRLAAEEEAEKKRKEEEEAEVARKAAEKAAEEAARKEAEAEAARKAAEDQAKKAAEDKQKVLDTLLELTKTAKTVEELEAAIDAAKAAGIEESAIEAAEARSKDLKARAKAAEKLESAIAKAEDISKLKKALSKAEEAGVEEDLLEKARNALAVEVPKQEAREKVQAAMAEGELEQLKAALKHAKEVGVPKAELAEAKEVLAALEERAKAATELQAAMDARVVSTLKEAIKRAKDLGVEKELMKQAKAVLKEEEPKEEARELLRQACEECNIETLRAAIQAGKNANLADSEMKNAGDLLKAEEEKERVLGVLRTTVQESKSVDTTSIDALREAKDKLTVAVKEAASAGLPETDLVDAEMRRKKLHNAIEDLKGSIRVFCRVRPLSQKELDNGDTSITEGVGSMGIKLKADEEKNFTFDAVYTPGTQDEVFEDCRDLVQSAADGYNVTMFAYGQTGAGKTFTMYGAPGMEGTAPKTIKEIFRVTEEGASRFDYTVKGSMLELYLNDLVDLLSKGNPAATKSKLNIKTEKSNAVSIENLTEEECHNEEMLLELLERGNKQRSIAATAMNSESSRSHLVIVIKIKSVNKKSKETASGKILLCDLAGSERLKKSMVEGSGQNEAIAINKSLTALGDVIEALSKGSKIVPYRNHKLTHLMQDSLGGSAKTLMFVNCSPANSNSEETLMSLKYAQRAKKVQNTVKKA